MNPSIEKYRAEQRERFNAFRKALSNESDRGCALFAAAYLDMSLGQLLRFCLVGNKNSDEDLFRSQAPLSTFSARIKMAYYLGKLSPSERKDLEVIRGVRNDFAHHPEYLDFDAQSIAARCQNLVNHWHSLDARPRAKFCGTVSALLAVIHTESAKAVPLTERRDTPISEETKENVRLEAQQMAERALEEMLKSLNNAPNCDDA